MKSRKMKLELKIINLLIRNKEKQFIINSIAKALEQHYSFVHRIINNLVEDEVIMKKKIGKSHVCSLNLENEKTFALIQLSEIEKTKEFYNKNKKLKLTLQDFVKSLSAFKNIFTIALFGSYAKATAVKQSDIDILLITKGKNKIKIEKIIKEIYAKYGKEIVLIIMTPNDFKKQKDKAIIKEIIKNHYVLYRTENFMNLAFK